MSASREKKQRQGSGPSERDTQAQQKAAAYKKKVRLYTGIGVVIVVLVAALLTWNSGIFQRGQTAVTVGDTNYTVNDLNYFYQDARYSSFYIYYSLGMTPPSDDTVMSSESGQTYREYFLDQALENMTSFTAAYDEAIKNGYSESDVADEVQSQIKSAKANASSNGYSYGAFLKLQYGRYMTAGAFESILTKVAVADAYASDHSDSLTYTDEEIQAYYEENKDSLDTFEYSYLYFTPEAVATTDEDGNDLELTDDEKAKLEEEALAAAKEKAEAALAALEDGGNAADLIEEYELTSSNSGDHTSSVGSSVSSVYSEKLFGMKAGEVALVENGTSGYYVIALHQRELSDDVSADVRHILIRAETTEDSEGNTVAPTDDAWAAAKEKAEQILAEYQAGEQTEDAFTALAKEYSQDVNSSGELNNDGLYTGITKTSGYVEEFLGWIFDTAHETGDVGLVQHEGDASSSSSYWGYHIMYYVGDTLTWKVTAEDALRSDDMTQWQDALKEGYTASLTSAADYVGT